MIRSESWRPRHCERSQCFTVGAGAITELLPPRASEVATVELRQACWLCPPLAALAPWHCLLDSSQPFAAHGHRQHHDLRA
eukprot:596190-Rhodomonas_salina.1